jgi:hypothetical protein
MFKDTLFNMTMSEDHILRYTDLAAVIQMAKARSWPTARIIREMSHSLPYLECLASVENGLEALQLARKAAPLLDISVSEFMRLRKNR